jgi:hypothetical protein
MARSKDEVAAALEDAHFAVEPGIERIFRLLAPDAREADPREPIKLLEVSVDTTADGIRPVYFGPHRASGIDYPSMIVEITPREFEALARDPSALPHGWRLGGEFSKPVVAAVEP